MNIHLILFPLTIFCFDLSRRITEDVSSRDGIEIRIKAFSDMIFGDFCNFLLKYSFKFLILYSVGRYGEKVLRRFLNNLYFGK